MAKPTVPRPEGGRVEVYYRHCSLEENKAGLYEPGRYSVLITTIFTILPRESAGGGKGGSTVMTGKTVGGMCRVEDAEYSSEQIRIRIRIFSRQLLLCPLLTSL